MSTYQYLDLWRILWRRISLFKFKHEHSNFEVNMSSSTLHLLVILPPTWVMLKNSYVIPQHDSLKGSRYKKICTLSVNLNEQNVAIIFDLWASRLNQHLSRKKWFSVHLFFLLLIELPTYNKAKDFFISTSQYDSA